MNFRVDRSWFLIFSGFLVASIVSSCQNEPLPGPLQPASPQPTFQSPATDDRCAPQEVMIFLNESNEMLQEFDDLVARAESTAPEDLAPVIKEMEAKGNSTDNLPSPLCALQAQAALKEYFVHMTQGYFRMHVKTLGITPQANRKATDEFNAAVEKLALFNSLSQALNELAKAE